MDPREVAVNLRQGQIRAAARAMRWLDDGDSRGVAVLKDIYPDAGRAFILGLTGSPGVGKSSLVNALIAKLREKGSSIGVVAVDPTSPFSGGAILGDRVRMMQHALDPEVFVRSLATRGAFGGLTPSTRAVVTVMDAMGKDVVIVETVGVGQDEVEVAGLADTTVVITVPGLGDDVQAIKAGILEVGDVFCVNKIDRAESGRAMAELEAMLELEGRGGRSMGWSPVVVGTCTMDGRGLDELLEAIEAHRAWLDRDQGQRLRQRRQAGAERELVSLLQLKALERIMGRMRPGELGEMAERMISGQEDPYTLCERLLGGFGAQER